jgi:hypothetical protein
MPNQPATATRTIRVPDDLWTQAKTVSTQAGETVTAVITRALTNYIQFPPDAGSMGIPTLPCPTCGKIFSRRGGGGHVVARHKTDEGEWCE